MAQEEIWEKEYKNPKLITNSNQPQLDFKHFIKWLRKSQHVDLNGLRVLDLGSGTGKNSIFLAERGSNVVGIELSSTAVRLADERAGASGVNASFTKGDIGTTLPYPNASFDLIIDVVSSNSLSESERGTYLKEISRILQPGGYVFVKALCKDGDKNAQNLIEKFPGEEKDTYVMPRTGIVERVWSREDITNFYCGFEFLYFERKSSYTIFEGKPFKRNFWLLYLKH